MFVDEELYKKIIQYAYGVCDLSLFIRYHRESY